MDKRSLVSYSPWGRKESDRTERFSFLIMSGLKITQTSSHIILTFLSHLFNKFIGAVMM